MQVYVWTDGSVRGNPGPGGWAAVLLADQIARIIGGFARHTTNNRMEVEALIQALEILKFSCDVFLNTDSQYLLLGLNKLLRNQMPGTNVDLWERLKAAMRRHNLSHIEKVLAHDKDVFNNLADAYAGYCGDNQITVNEFYKDNNKLLNQFPNRKTVFIKGRPAWQR